MVENTLIINPNYTIIHTTHTATQTSQSSHRKTVNNSITHSFSCTHPHSSHFASSQIQTAFKIHRNNV